MKRRAGPPGRRRRRAAVERRFTIGGVITRLGSILARPRTIAFLLAIGLVSFTAGPIMRYCKDHRYFAVREVEVRGTERLAASRVRSWLGMVEGRSIWRAAPAALEEKLRRHPEIADARVRRRLPDRLEVTVTEREPAALVRDAHGFFLADREGVVFGRARPDGTAWAELPIVTVTREAVPAGPEDVGPPRPGADRALGDARRLPSRILGEAIALAGRMERGQGGIGVSEVAIEGGSSEGGAPDLVVFSADGRLAVRLGWGRWDAKLAALGRVVEHALRTGQGGLVGRLDVRDPEAVVARWAREEAA